MDRWTIYYRWPPNFLSCLQPWSFSGLWLFIVILCRQNCVQTGNKNSTTHVRTLLTYILPKGLSFCTFPVVRKSFKENKSFLCILSDRLFPKKDKLRDKNPPHHHHQKCPCRAVWCLSILFAMGCAVQWCGATLMPGLLESVLTQQFLVWSRNLYYNVGEPLRLKWTWSRLPFRF